MTFQPAIVLALWLLAEGEANLVSAASGQAGLGSQADISPSDHASAEILSHHLSVNLVPDSHQLFVTDRMVVKVTKPLVRQAVFTLAPTLQVEHVQNHDPSGQPLVFTSKVISVSSDPNAHTQRVEVQFPEPAVASHVFTLEWRYQGIVHDPPREPRHLRFVTPSETSGHIGPEGIYLSGETQWYPDISGSLPTFHLEVTTPKGWTSLTHGKEIRRQENSVGPVMAEWDVTANTEALTLVANKFIVGQRDWRDEAGNTIQVATYLFPEDAHLSSEYLDASVRYLDAYGRLLGPYPYPKFAVVENFFASGLGMPSFTLLGNGVIKRHYIQPYALGHEIVHSWIGNSVLNRLDHGNWVEGLTTYLANYYWHELMGNRDQAREQRRMMLLGYAVYVRPDQDYAVGRFKQKTDDKDNAIGYQKSAMVFHMLRQEIGETAFWGSLKKLVADHQGRYADWQDLERIFSQVAKKDLRWFFAQWVERAGAPTFSLDRVDAQLLNSGPNGPFVVKTRLHQEGAPFQVSVELRVTMEDGSVRTEAVEMTSPDQDIRLTVPGKPIAVEIDPDWALFRRIERRHLPPMLNLYVSDRHRTVIAPEAGTEAERRPYYELLQRMMTQNVRGSMDEKVVIRKNGEGGISATDGSVLVLGGPAQNGAAKEALAHCGDKVRLTDDQFTIGDKTYDGPATALLVSCRRTDHPDGVVTVFLGLSSEAASKVARLLFFYGWQSYVVFQDGVVRARGDWESDSLKKEVHIERP
ncbi:MAG: M1 family metallopeptidase [Nitrospiraceae bacterium]